MKIGIVVGSVREGRQGRAIGEWVTQIANRRESASYELIDLKGFELPLLTSAVHPMMARKRYDDERVQAWSDAIDDCDAYVFVTAEYNHAVPGAFKNAIDSLGAEWQGKAIAFIGYGSVGGVRAIENWRTIVANFSMVDLRTELNLGLFTDFTDGAFSPAERRPDEVNALLDGVEKMTTKLQALNRLEQQSVKIGG